MPKFHPPTPFKHLLLDLDGTLIHSGTLLTSLEFIRRILPRMKIHLGWRKAWNTLKECRDVLEHPSQEKTNQERLLETFQKNLHLSQEEAKTALRTSLLDVFPKLESHFGKMKGAAEFVEWAKGRYSLTLTTNPVWPIELVKMRMNWGGINPDFFQCITTADRMHACKPHPEYYNEVLTQENFQRGDCLLIGNERKMDLPAADVGIAVFLIRKNARELTCIRPATATYPGAWRGNYGHLREFLSTAKSPTA